MDSEIARQNMVSQQVRTWNVLNDRLLDLFLTIPREDFVPKRYAELAFSDSMIPIGFGEHTLPPSLVGKILQHLDIKKHQSILEVGTGTGYITAFLANLGSKVTTIEIIPELSKIAEHNLNKLDITNVNFITQDAFQFEPIEDYDLIIYTGSIPFLAPKYCKHLKKLGKFFGIIGKTPTMSATIVTKEEDCFKEQSLFETVVPQLKNCLTKDKFFF